MKEKRNKTYLPMGPCMVIFSIKGEYLLSEVKFLSRSIGSQSLSNPAPMMPKPSITKINELGMQRGSKNRVKNTKNLKFSQK